MLARFNACIGLPIHLHHQQQQNMGSGDWFKTILSLKRSKETKHKQFEKKYWSSEKSTLFPRMNGASRKKGRRRHLTPDVAATKIQCAYRAYKARKGLHHLKGIVRVRRVLEQSHSVKNQATSALTHIHLWSRVQAEIRARWLAMVTDTRTRQKRLENQLKLDAKFHELEVEWSGGPETMEEIVNRIKDREAAAAKRERTMAYAFSHQWRANSNQYFGQSYYDISKESWGWSWKERWVAVRPWEIRYRTLTHSVPNKVETKHKPSEIFPNVAATMKPVKTTSSDVKVSTDVRKTSGVSQVAIARAS